MQRFSALIAELSVFHFFFAVRTSYQKFAAAVTAKNCIFIVRIAAMRANISFGIFHRTGYRADGRSYFPSGFIDHGHRFIFHIAGYLSPEPRKAQHSAYTEHGKPHDQPPKQSRHFAL